MYSLSSDCCTCGDRMCYDLLTYSSTMSPNNKQIHAQCFDGAAAAAKWVMKIQFNYCINYNLNACDATMVDRPTSASRKLTHQFQFSTEQCTLCRFIVYSLLQMKIKRETVHRLHTWCLTICMGEQCTHKCYSTTHAVEWNFNYK